LVRTDRRRLAAFAIGQFRRQEDLPVVAGLHARQHFLPATQHLVDLEADRLATREGAVELQAAGSQRTAVVDADLAGGGRAAAAAGLDHAVLDAVRQRLDAGLAAVFRHEAVAL